MNVSLEGDTGPIKFNWYGDRLASKYNVINVGFNSSTVSVGSIEGEDVDVRMEDIVWPGNQTEIPEGIFVSNHLQVNLIQFLKVLRCKLSCFIRERIYHLVKSFQAVLR